MTASFYRLRHVSRHPTLIVVAYAVRLAAAFGLSWNWAKILGDGGVMAWPRKDSELFAPGAALLLRTIAEQEQSISRLAGFDLILVIGIAIVGCVLAAFAFDVLSTDRDASKSTPVCAPFRAVPAMLGISMSYWLSLIGVFVFAKLMYLLVPAIIYPIVGERGSDIAILLLAVIVAATSFFLFVVGDLARAIAVVYNRRPLDAVVLSIRCLRQQWAKCLLGAAYWAVPALSGPPIVEYYLASARVQWTHRTITLLLVHQLTALALCVLHLCWWSEAIELIRHRKIQDD